MYKKTQGTLHSYHSAQLPQNSDEHDARKSSGTQTRQYLDVKLGKASKFLEINSINRKIGLAWNNLPKTIKESKYKTVNTFTKHVKEFYLSKYQIECVKLNCYICN